MSTPGAYAFYWFPDVQHKIQNSGQERTMNIKDSRKRVVLTQGIRAKERWHFRVTMFKINRTHFQINSFLTLSTSSKSLSLIVHFLDNAYNFVSCNFVIHEHVICKCIKAYVWPLDVSLGSRRIFLKFPNKLNPNSISHGYLMASRRVNQNDCNNHSSLTPILLMWRIWWAPNNASRWQMGFNSVFKGLK
jgi:hypothetical protein